MSAEVTTQSTSSELKRDSGVVVAMGIALVVLGFLAIGAPLASGVAVTYLVGGAITLSGACQTLSAFRAPSWGLGLLGFGLGAMTLVAGIVVLGHPLFGLSFLTLLLAGYFLVEGLFEVAHAWRLRPVSGWGWSFFNGVVTLLLAILIWRQWPLSGTWAIGLLVGIKILFSGWAMIAVGSAARRAS